MLTTEEKIKQLQDIIKEGLGDRTQRAFAIEVGLTPEYLSRLMKAGYKITPSVKTLVALAVSLPNTTKEELLSLFEIENSDEKYSPVELSAIIYKDLQGTIRRVLKNKIVFDATRSFLDTISLYNIHGDLSFFKLDTKIDEEDGVHKDLIKADYEVNGLLMEYFFVVSYYPVFHNEKGKYKHLLIKDISFNKNLLDDFEQVIKTTVASPYLCTWRNIDNGSDETEKRYATITYGFGFYVNELEESTVIKFINKYSQMVGEEVGDGTIFEKVAKLMKLRTRLNFKYIEGDNGKGIIVDTTEKDSMIKTVVQKYASELGCSEYGNIHIVEYKPLKEDELYQTNE